jgi:RHS repeat-associated protein
VWDAVRKPFGERTVAVGQVEVLLGFPGQYYDQETNNYYNYFRDYDPTTGRYLQSDPIGLGGGVNTYAYVNGNPVRFTDSLGLQVDGCWLVRDYIHNFLCKDNNCAGLLPWPDSGAGGCPDKGQIVNEIKDDAFFCSEVDSGKDQCEQESFEKCVEENINRKNGYPGSCDSYDFFGGRNCISWKNEVIEQCRQVSKWSCM